MRPTRSELIETINDVAWFEQDWVGLSTDAKPTENIVEGSTFFEEDTGKAFIMKADHTWVEI